MACQSLQLITMALEKLLQMKQVFELIQFLMIL